MQLVRLLTWLLATGALALLILIVLDELKMRGELIDYSFTRGHITTPPHALAHQNTLLLHKDVDSLPFTFSTGPLHFKGGFATGTSFAEQLGSGECDDF